MNDGGAPITHYIVEGRREWNPFWEEKGEYFPDAKNIRCRVSDLTEGATYYFRAKAVNLAGPSDPSGVSKPITIKER